MIRASIDLHALVREHGGYVSRDGRTAYIPGPDHSRRDRGVKVILTDDGRPIVHSFHGDNWREVKGRLGLDVRREWISRGELRRRRQARQTAERRRLKDISAFCGQLWEGTQPALSSPVETYLRSRGIIQRPPPVLRFHPACPRSYPTKDKRMAYAPAMVALVQGPDGKARGLHITFIKPDGSDKAFGDRSRVMFGDVAGGAVRLGAPEDGELGVCEGIETALSFGSLHDLACWAAMSSSLMTSFSPPPGLAKLAIGADGDRAGRDAATALAERARKDCNTLIIAAPEGRDWNDILREVK